MVEVESKLNVELDHNHMKKVVVEMFEKRLAALETHSASMIQLQGASLESLRELNSKFLAQTPAQPPSMSSAERERRIQAFSESLE